MTAKNIRWPGYYWIKREDKWEIAKVDLISIKDIKLKQVSFCGEMATYLLDEWEVKPIKDEDERTN